MNLGEASLQLGFYLIMRHLNSNTSEFKSYFDKTLNVRAAPLETGIGVAPHFFTGESKGPLATTAEESTASRGWQRVVLTCEGWCWCVLPARNVPLHQTCKHSTQSTALMKEHRNGFSGASRQAGSIDREECEKHV